MLTNTLEVFKMLLKKNQHILFSKLDVGAGTIDGGNLVLYMGHFTVKYAISGHGPSKNQV